MASSSNGNGHTGIQLGRGSTLGLSDVRIEHGQVSPLSVLLRADDASTDEGTT